MCIRDRYICVLVKTIINLFINPSVVSCRSLWALLEFRVSRCILRSSTKKIVKKIVLIMDGVVETISLIASIKVCH